jgi:DNA-binding NtrC family response regulator
VVSGEARGPDPPADFRWQAFFHRSREPLFLLNRRRRLVFVNRAWEELTGMPGGQARGLACTRRAPAEPGPWEALARALAPPAEVLHGQPGRARRLAPAAGPARRWWDLVFFPLQDEHGLLGILGTITPVAGDAATPALPLPEKLVALRQAVAQRYGFDQLASSLPALRRVAEQVRLAAQTGVPVLVWGEPGTGKQWLARTIHHQGRDRERTFAALDCARLPPAALAAALFGDEGLTRRADVGTLYLKQPARLPRDLQARLGEWLAVRGEWGAAPSPPTGPRVIAGGSADPATAELLAEELHCALGTLVIHVPPLRERQADLPDLVERLLERANGDGPRRVVGLTPPAWELVRAYPWPGNLRELYAVLAGARARATGERLDAADLPAYLRLAVTLDRTPAASPERVLPLDQLLEEVERRLIRLALRMAQGNKSRAAELLAIWRPRLHRRMEVLGIDE